MCAICLTLHYFIVTFAAKRLTRGGWFTSFGVSVIPYNLLSYLMLTRYRYATVVKFR